MTKENSNSNELIQTTKGRLDNILQSAQNLVNQGETEVSSIVDELFLVVAEIETEIEKLITTHQDLELECQHYQELMAGTSDAYLMTDLEGKIKKANQAAADLLSFSEPNLLVDKYLANFISQAKINDLQAQIKLLSVGEHLNEEVIIKIADREKLLTKISVTTIYDREENIIALSWLIHSNLKTNQKQTNLVESEKEKELDELKTRLIQTVSHEFRTPLNMIHISAQLLEKHYHNFSQEKSKLFFHKTRNAVKYITELLDDVLAYNQANSGKIQLEKTLLELEKFTGKLVEEQQLLRDSKYQISFWSNCQSTLVCIDENLLHKILGNLISNALKYSPQGGEIKLQLNCIDERAIFEISDRGIGIPAEEIPYLFQPFHRAKNAGTIPGTGLGLAIVKKAVEILGGEITLESKLNVGTKVTVSLPILNEKSKNECKIQTKN